MELLGLKFSKNVRFDVEVISDYKIEGTFNPNAACDTEYYGYRETDFKLTNVESLVDRVGYELWLPDTQEVVDDFYEYFYHKLTLIIQNAIDDKQGEAQ